MNESPDKIAAIKALFFGHFIYLCALQTT